MANWDFDRDKRLLTARQFSAVFDFPTDKVPGKHILLLARENGLNHPRLSLVISKKNVKLAVQCNHPRRLIRESLRHNQETLAGWDIVVIAHRGLDELENPELYQQFGKLWKRPLRNRPRTESPADAPGVADGTHAQADARASRSLQCHPPFDDPAPSSPVKLYFLGVRGYRATRPATQ